MSSLDAKVIDYLGQFTDEEGKVWDKVVIKLPPQKNKWTKNPTPDRVIIAHDYVSFHGSIGIEQENDGKGNYPIKTNVGACNWIHAEGAIHISIRDMYDIVLPLLNKHKYLQPSHFKTRQDEGKSYEPYCYSSAIIEFYDEERKEYMVSFRRSGESKWETVSMFLFNQIKDSLKLSLSTKDFKEDTE